MAPVLYGSVGYICTNRVLLAAAELGEELEFVHVDTMKGEHKVYTTHRFKLVFLII